MGSGMTGRVLRPRKAWVFSPRGCFLNARGVFEGFRAWRWAREMFHSWHLRMLQTFV